MLRPSLPSERSPFARGVLNQWRQQLPHAEIPPLLGIMAWEANWLPTFLHARFLASGSDAARRSFADFESSLCLAFNCPPIDWPAQFDHDGSVGFSPSQTKLGQLAPSQQLLVRNHLRQSDRWAQAYLTPLLERAFGAALPSGEVQGEQRLHLCGLALPGSMRDRWEEALGLEPPSLFMPASSIAAKCLISAVFEERDEGEAFTALERRKEDEVDAPTLIDLILTAATLHACVRSGLDDSSTHRASAANDAQALPRSA